MKLCCYSQRLSTLLALVTLLNATPAYNGVLLHNIIRYSHCTLRTPHISSASAGRRLLVCMCATQANPPQCTWAALATCMRERHAGHTNVFYIGDRVKRPGQHNGKSANMNHAILNYIYPGGRSAADVPASEVMLVMDCDHMVKPDIFNKMATCMLDESLAVLLAPQRFHNVIQPDFMDASCTDFMVGRMPFRFAVGMCYITGATATRNVSATATCMASTPPAMYLPGYPWQK